ncbi:glycoside hydrolase family 13 protein [Anaeromicropila herbilytica]|uniref:Cyclomaltodextrinase n=1 Tax=Anaeromicropila herbilytica TaxID=2785025 RepID=A0A7R7IBZ1_9FIRM|nr:glycoside hydrolase family 13 protein [Anaeromicropila herbilytica]BCN29316.1 cyclomaltodextrinase [Anaeromicropila herbilytica]
MRIAEIMHRCAFTDCYPIDKNKVRVNLRTGKDIDEVYIIHGDPYTPHITGESEWRGERELMENSLELRSHKMFHIILNPEYKREQYYFELHSKDEVMYYLEDDFYQPEEMNLSGKTYQYFIFPWLNPSDVFQVPEWVEDTIWYQIFPDRYCRGDMGEKRVEVKPWKCEEDMSYWDNYGGDIKGIISKLDYMKDLGITGLYLTPIFDSNSNHKYNTSDYKKIDSDFGSEEDLKELIEEAHKRGIRIMLDAVFNHSGRDFAPWRDVLQNGKNSPYYNWFFIQQWPIETDHTKEWYKSYYSFAFASGMPKLNTNNPEVIEYIISLCKHWVTDLHIDGIRFDVGNEVSHTFLKAARRELKIINPELYLLGEIWRDSISWLQGDEYDSVMNYPFLESINDFWVHKNRTANEFMYSMNRCYTLYQEQVNGVLFNCLDSHDVPRAFTRCGSMDVFFQQLAILLTMQGSPSLYYGTEIAMSGGQDPINRKCMPWEEIEEGKYQEITGQVKQLIAIRREYSQTKCPYIEWVNHEGTRLIHYCKKNEDTNEIMNILINAEEKDIVIGTFEHILFARHYEEGIIKAGGVVIGIGFNNFQ